ncbi:MAG: sulfite exporter TauE/SafE family protein [Bacillota bacterium]
MPEGMTAAVILFCTAVVSGAAGFGFAMLALTSFSLFFDPRTAVAFMALHTLTQNVVQLIGLRRYCRWRELAPLLVAAVLGVPAGAVFLKTVDPDLIQRSLGLVVIAFVLASLALSRKGAVPAGFQVPDRRPRTEAVWRVLTGLGGGVLMGAFLSGGPPLVMYSLWKGGSRFTIKAALQAFFLFCNAYALALYALSGLLTESVLRGSVTLLPFTLGGTLIGMYLFQRMPYPVFRKLLLVLLALVGGSLIVK